MQVTCEASPAGGGKRIAVTLSDEDMQAVEGYADLSVAEKFKALTDRGDLMLITYMLRRGDVSEDYAGQRIREIQAGQSGI